LGDARRQLREEPLECIVERLNVGALSATDEAQSRADARPIRYSERIERAERVVRLRLSDRKTVLPSQHVAERRHL
jgi:hypothetical protein